MYSIEKTDQISKLNDYLLEKYGAEHIIVTGYLDQHPTSIGLATKTHHYTAYITDNGNKNMLFSVSLKNHPISAEFPYMLGEEFDEITLTEVEEINIKHLGIVEAQKSNSK